MTTEASAARKARLIVPPETGVWLARHGLRLLLIGVPSVLIFGVVLKLCGSVWFAADSPLGYQALIPLGALALGWSRSHDVRLVCRELATLFPDPNHPKRRGNTALVWIGGLVLLGGVLALSPPVGLTGFIVLAAGVVFYSYGPFVLRSLFAPLGCLFLMLVPPPLHGLMSAINVVFQMRSTAFAGYILRAVGQKPQILGSTLVLRNQTPLEVPLSFSGLETLLAALAFAVIVALWHRTRFASTMLLFFFAVVTAMVANIVRILLLVATQNASWLPALPFTIFACFNIWLMGRRLAPAPARDDD